MAALTKIEICNLALSRVGVKEYISSITEQTAEAEACNLTYDHVLREALAICDWTFARKRGTLIEEAGDPPEEWAFQYQLPADLITARYIDNGLTEWRQDQIFPFVIENPSGSKSLLYCQIEDAILKYTFDQTDPAHYPSWFSDYAAWELAADIALPITSKDEIWRTALSGAYASKNKAIARNHRSEQKRPVETDGAFLAAR